MQTKYAQQGGGNKMRRHIRRSPRLYLSRSRKGWINIRLARRDESVIAPGDLGTAIRTINGKRK